MPTRQQATAADARVRARRPGYLVAAGNDTTMRAHSNVGGSARGDRRLGQQCKSACVCRDKLNACNALLAPVISGELGRQACMVMGKHALWSPAQHHMH